MIMRDQGRNKIRGLPGWALLCALAAGLAVAQQQATTPPAGQSSIPDAPSASRPVEKFPATPEPMTTPPPPAEAPAASLGGSPLDSGSSRNELFTLTKNVNFVVVPVTVKDENGHLIEGLTRQDFKVLEDGAEQRMTFFTSDPFPLSAAVVLDLGVPDIVFRKVRETLPALVGAFGQFDEVGLYTFATSVQKVQDFLPAVNEKFYQAVDRMKKKASAREGGPPVVGGPFGYPPSTSGRPIDPGQNPMPSYAGQREAKVLNDAILQAALDLSRRESTRRKVLFVISDGMEYRSSAGYGEVLKVLLTNQISIYAVGVGSSAIPGYGKAQRIHLPRMGYGDILPKYASATGGEVFSELSESAIERAYSRLTEEARNQYTIGYTTRATPSSSYRDIEVRVSRPGLAVKAKQGYYPLPPQSRPSP
jgi:VWFA-related protein